MPLKKTYYGGECPLGKFEIDIAAGGGCYTKDPVEACFSCNFANLSSEEFNLEKICQCPADMTWKSYDDLRKRFVDEYTGDKTKTNFQQFIKDNYPLKV